MPFAFRFECFSGNIFYAEAYGNKNNKLVLIFSSLFKEVTENSVRALRLSKKVQNVGTY